MLTEVNPGFHVWHVWCDHQGVSHQKKEWLDDFKLITFIKGMASIWQSGPRDDATHVCRTTPRPPELLAAYAIGHPGSHWRGVDVIAEWCAAEHHFVTPGSMESWQHLAQQRLEIIPAAAHHALLERSGARKR